MINSLPDDVVRTVLLFLEDLGTPMALGVHIRVRNQLWEEISEMTLDPRNYLDDKAFVLDASAVSFLKKLQQLPTKTDRRGNAIEKWREGEVSCFRANERLCRYLPENRLFDDRCDAISSFLDEIRKTILSWLGPRPDELALGRFGPGATYTDRGGKTTVPDKMSAVPVMTRGAIWFLPQWLGTQWGATSAQHHGEINYVPGNRFTTVPKTAKTDRAIASEPSINVFYQLALGRQIRHRLRKAGWDLDRAQDIHRQVACESSVTREFATLDLSNASDTVAYNLVKLLLPRDWFDQLEALRSPKTLIEGKWVVLEKFSSMGNGFTFELETLIFAAICSVSSRKLGFAGQLGSDVFVFGDDIIVKTMVAHPLKSALEFLGFELNDEKSFFDDSPFRESCGGDFFNGKPVRPYFLKDLPNGPSDYIAFANGLRALLNRIALTGCSVAKRAWFSILDCIPTRVRSCRGPQDLGDVVIHDDERYWTYRWRGDIRYLRVFRPHRHRVIRYEGFRPDVVLACATYGCGNRRGGVIPRDGVLSFKVGWGAYS